MTYPETVEYLYRLLPDYQRTGAAKGKWDLSKTYSLLEAVGNPHLGLPVVHVAGTNGKGTTSHLLAAAAQSNGLRTGLYTSPHYVDYRERIRLDGQLVPKVWVVDFVAKHRKAIESLEASFFEFTVVMALAYFAEQEVDLAVVEVGMGGRLDSTNVVEPLLTVVTNIGLDHTEFLGDTRPLIAKEKAGIFKSNVPAVVGVHDEETWPVFEQTAEELGSPIYSASQLATALKEHQYYSMHYPGLEGLGLASDGLDGVYTVRGAVGAYGPFFLENLTTAAAAWRLLAPKLAQPSHLPSDAITDLAKLTGWRGRFSTLSQNPLVIADAGHNVEAWAVVAKHLDWRAQEAEHLYIVCGFVKGKPVEAFAQVLAKARQWTTAEVHFLIGDLDLTRNLPADESSERIREILPEHDIAQYRSIPEAYQAALARAKPTDVVFVGGSTFVVGAVFAHLEPTVE